MRGQRSGRSLPIAAFLTFLWPGLGQWYEGRAHRALTFALPTAVVAAVAALFLADGFQAAALRLLSPTVATWFLVAVVGVAVWRLAALGEHVLVHGGPARIGRRNLAIVGLLGALIIASHLYVGSIGLSFYRAGTAIFEPLPTPAIGATPGPGESGIPIPFETPATASSRINVLLLGIDSSATRNHALTDTIIVASIDPVSGATSMVSFPRDIARFPMYDGGEFDAKINSLVEWANNHPKQYPDGGTATMMREVGFLLGIPIHYYAAINLDGFVQLVDAMGHITINNPRDINDPVYGGWTDGRPIGFYLTAGVHVLDGQETLAYARSRKGAGDSDFTRAARQQQILQAVRERLTDPSMLGQLPAIVEAAGRTLRTNFPQDRLGEMLSLAQRVDDAKTKRHVLGPPYSVHPPTNTTFGTYILILDIARLEALSAKLYGPDSAFWTPPASPAPSPAPSAP